MLSGSDKPAGSKPLSGVCKVQLRLYSQHAHQVWAFVLRAKASHAVVVGLLTQDIRHT